MVSLCKYQALTMIVHLRTSKIGNSYSYVVHQRRLRKAASANHGAAKQSQTLTLKSLLGRKTQLTLTTRLGSLGKRDVNPKPQIQIPEALKP